MLPSLEDETATDNGPVRATLTTVDDLGASLRAWRDRLTPPHNGSTRRAPGLRRQEVAERAGVSVGYLTRLEQGRATRPSPRVVRTPEESERIEHEIVGDLHAAAARWPADERLHGLIHELRATSESPRCRCRSAVASPRSPSRRTAATSSRP